MTPNQSGRGLVEGHPDVHILRICEILGDPTAYRTLVSLIDNPKSISDICIEQGTPLSSTYKAIKRLQNVSLVYVKGYANVNMRRIAVYSSRVKSIHIEIDKGGGQLRLVEVS